MAQKTIPELSEATTIDENSLFAIDSGVQTFKITTPNVKKSLAALGVMTYSERQAIGAPFPGQEIFNTDSKCKQVYTGDEWVNLGDQCGDIKYSAVSSPVGGYLECDGSAVSRTTYAQLFAKIATSHGQGDNSTTFNLPDYRGRFLRVVDGDASRDPDKAGRSAMATGGNTGNNVGSVQAQATRKNGLALNDPGHNHDISVHMNVAPVSNSGLATGSNRETQVNSFVFAHSATTGVTLSNGDNETRPVNVYVKAYIKY